MQTALVVDDDALFLDSMMRTLKGHFEFQGISDSSLILTKIAIKCPDIILLDYNMVPHNGIEVLTSIRSAGYTVPIIMMTGFRSPEMVAQAMALGIDYIVSKPIESNWLIHIIKKLIQRDD